MPPLMSFSKEHIVEILTDRLKEANAIIASLQDENSRWQRKSAHGCTEALCSECDQAPAEDRPQVPILTIEYPGERGAGRYSATWTMELPGLDLDDREHAEAILAAARTLGEAISGERCTARITGVCEYCGGVGRCHGPDH